MKTNETEKILLNKITFCIPIRMESSYRIRNLSTILKFIDNCFYTNFIILEADKISHFDENMRVKNLHYYFVEDYDSIFHRTKYINQMLSLCTTPYAAIWDTDVLVSQKQIELAYELLLTNEYELVYPYSGIFYNLNEYISDLFVKNFNFKILEHSHTHKTILYGYHAVGGAFMVNIEKYKESGWENEHFYGWGPEDAERYSRLQILEKPIKRINGVLYHLFHTRGPNSGFANINIEYNTKLEFCKVCSMTTNELINYTKSWEWIE